MSGHSRWAVQPLDWTYFYTGRTSSKISVVITPNTKETSTPDIRNTYIYKNNNKEKEEVGKGPDDKK